MKNKRLDTIMGERLLAANKRDAFIKVTEGRVFINGQKAVSPAQIIKPNVLIQLRDEKKYVGRGALKLEAALEAFSIDVSGKICADIGAATGGFTQILLEHGAKKVYAIDTARGKLALPLREDSRVAVMENTDVRDVKELPDTIQIIVIDVSLTPLRTILPRARRLLREDGDIVALFKPQYETRDQKILTHGVVRNDNDRKKLIDEFVSWAERNSFRVVCVIASPILGSAGNQEYLFHLRAY